MKKYFGKKNFIALLVIFGAVIISALIIFIDRIFPVSESRQSNTPSPASEPMVTLIAKEVTFDSSSPQEVINKIYQIVDNNSDLKFSKPSKYFLWWVTDDNWSVTDRFAIGLEMAIDAHAFQDDRHPCVSRAECVRNKNFQKLNQRIGDIFKRNGFILNTANSSASEDDEKLYDYVLAFEKGNTRCAMTSNPDETSDDVFPSLIGVHYSVACSDKINERYAEQLPFLKALNDRNASVEIQKVSGDFALVQFFYRREGMYGILKKTDGMWHVLHKSQESPPCELIIRYAIPKEIYEHPLLAGCYDRSEDTTIWRTSPNGPPR